MYMSWIEVKQIRTCLLSLDNFVGFVVAGLLIALKVAGMGRASTLKL